MLQKYRFMSVRQRRDKPGKDLQSLNHLFPGGFEPTNMEFEEIHELMPFVARQPGMH